MNKDSRIKSFIVPFIFVILLLATLYFIETTPIEDIRKAECELVCEDWGFEFNKSIGHKCCCNSPVLTYCTGQIEEVTN